MSKVFHLFSNLHYSHNDKLQTNGLGIEDNETIKYNNQLPKPEQNIKTFL